MEDTDSTTPLNTTSKSKKSKARRGGPRKNLEKEGINLLYFANGVRANEMRVAGMSWNEIGEILQCTANAALVMARAAREKIEKETAEELREVHHQRYEWMFKSLTPKIEQGRERAVEVAAQVLEKDAKLMGINRDVETQAGSFQPILIQIRPDPDDPEAIRLAKLKSANSEPKLLPPPDQSA